MARERNPNRNKAFDIYKSNNGNITPKEIASILNESVAKIRNWKSIDEWDKQLGVKKNKRGAPKGNLNAVGNKGGGAPKGNLNAFKDGSRIPEERFASKKFLSKYLPRVTEKIMNEIEESGINSLDILWTNIQIQFTAIIRSQKIMNVKTHNDLTKELKRKKETPGKFGDGIEEEYELQFAWDKQERFLSAQAKALKTLNDMIKTYEELLHKNWELSTEEQRLRVDKLKYEIKLLSGEEDYTESDGFIQALEGKVEEVWES